MPNYRRRLRSGGTHFFTLVTYHRAPFLCSELARRCLRTSIRECRARWPFEIDAIVLLPEHVHTIWTLPEGDNAYSLRLAWIKRRFSQLWLSADGKEAAVTIGAQHDRRRGIWQPRFWEHTIRDADDLRHHVEYIHYNPVKHGHARSVASWPYSSFHRYVMNGVYRAEWGAEAKFTDIGETVGE